MDKPEIDFPDGPPPTDLEITDVTEGDGAEATAGSTVSVHYVGRGPLDRRGVRRVVRPRAARCSSGSASARSSPAGTPACRG